MEVFRKCINDFTVTLSWLNTFKSKGAQLWLQRLEGKLLGPIKNHKALMISGRGISQMYYCFNGNILMAIEAFKSTGAQLWLQRLEGKLLGPIKVRAFNALNLLPVTGPVTVTCCEIEHVIHRQMNTDICTCTYSNYTM